MTLVNHSPKKTPLIRLIVFLFFLRLTGAIPFSRPWLSRLTQTRTEMLSNILINMIMAKTISPFVDSLSFSSYKWLFKNPFKSYIRRDTGIIRYSHSPSMLINLFTSSTTKSWSFAESSAMAPSFATALRRSTTHWMLKSQVLIPQDLLIWPKSSKTYDHQVIFLQVKNPSAEAKIPEFWWVHLSFFTIFHIK